mmetsp:Transcript_12318/g.18395  ORF Transcript_12318/g.18395 Transcript_12318/m.18395 type:complete len:115 (-) Transcript_12318:2284-2628(-)
MENEQASNEQQKTQHRLSFIERANEVSLAQQIAQSRENFKYVAGYTLFYTSAIAAYKFLLRRPVSIHAMIVPFTGLTAASIYTYDQGYGTHYVRMHEEAYAIRSKERYRYFGRE